MNKIIMQKWVKKYFKFEFLVNIWIRNDNYYLKKDWEVSKDKISR